MQRAIWKVSMAIMIVGILAIGLTTIFGYNTVTFLERVNINGIWIWKIDASQYLQEIQTSITNVARLEMVQNPRQWINSGEWDAIINNLAFILDVIIFALNIMLYPFRIGGYIIQVALSLIGLPVLSYTDAHPLSWLLNLCKYLVSLSIPMV